MGDFGAAAADILEADSLQAEFGGDHGRVVVVGAVAAGRVRGLVGDAGAGGVRVAQGRPRSPRRTGASSPPPHRVTPTAVAGTAQ